MISSSSLYCRHRAIARRRSSELTGELRPPPRSSLPMLSPSHLGTRNIDISNGINGSELDQNPTADKRCQHYISLTSWCCKTLPQQFCWPTQKECLANCPSVSSSPHAVP
ncbi:hypothetical protein V6N12_056477 [Hibiscus sabdariffa]|uniref:Uncharacterized protein n=1 Tax=Hibiscus sabdariffa TaxID=183260 RepID=A0ABR2CT37_9ROSI